MATKKTLKPEDMEKEFNRQLKILNNHLRSIRAIKNLNQESLHNAINSCNVKDFRFFQSICTIKTIAIDIEGSANPSIEDVISVQDELLELKNLYQNEIDFQQHLCANVDSDYDSSGGWAESFYFETSYIVLNEESNDRLQQIAKDETKKWLAAQINQIKGTKLNQYNIDCKIVELWKADKIDFETFCSILTANCKL